MGLRHGPSPARRRAGRRARRRASRARNPPLSASLSPARPSLSRKIGKERRRYVAERMIEANGVELCTEPFGDPADPPILLVMGVGSSMLWWDEGFCGMLSGAGRFVIRYDHRDTGRSVTYEPGHPGYTGADLVADAAGVLDAYGIPRCARRRRLGGRGVRAAAGARIPRSRPFARPDQHFSGGARRPRAPAPYRRVPAVRDSPWRWTGPTRNRSSSIWLTTPECSREDGAGSMRRRCASLFVAMSSARGTSRGAEPRCAAGG